MPTVNQLLRMERMRKLNQKENNKKTQSKF